MKKVTMEILPKLWDEGRGIPDSKKQEIIIKLCPMMPVNRRQFWNDILTNNDVSGEQFDE